MYSKCSSDIFIFHNTFASQFLLINYFHTNNCFVCLNFLFILSCLCIKLLFSMLQHQFFYAVSVRVFFYFCFIFIYFYFILKDYFSSFIFVATPTRLLRTRTPVKMERKNLHSPVKWNQSEIHRWGLVLWQEVKNPSS